MIEKSFECLFRLKYNIHYINNDIFNNICYNEFNRPIGNTFSLILKQLVSDSNDFIIIDLVVVAIICFCLKRMSSNKNNMSWLLYLLGHIFSSIAWGQTISSIKHLRLILFIYSFNNHYRILSIIILSDLIISDISYSTLLLFMLSIQTTFKVSNLILICLLFYYTLKYNLISLNQIYNYFDSYYSFKSVNDYGTTGIWWYLLVQYFEDYSKYFLLLLQIQPFLYTIPLTTRINHCKNLVLILMISLILYYDVYVQSADVVFILSILSTNINIVNKMKHLPLINVGILFPFILSPAMNQLWIINGSGNANYLFFQGLILWLFLGLGITEYTTALIEYNDYSNKSD